MCFSRRAQATRLHLQRLLDELLTSADSTASSDDSVVRTARQEIAVVFVVCIVLQFSFDTVG